MTPLDLPVVLIKFRDYALWFGPAYLIALVLGASTDIALRRLLQKSIVGGNPALQSGSFAILCWYVMGRSPSPYRLPLYLYVWLGVASEALSWSALIITGALSWPLSLLRAGSTLALASLLALAVATLPAARNGKPVPVDDETEPVERLPLHKEWWQAFSYRFDKSSNQFLLTIVLGAALIGLAPQLYSSIDKLFATPISYFAGAATGLALPIGPGVDAPVLAALRTKGADISLIIGLMLGVAVSRPQFVRPIREAYGRGAMALFLLIAWFASAAVAWLASLVAASIGLD